MTSKNTDDKMKVVTYSVDRENPNWLHPLMEDYLEREYFTEKDIEEIFVELKDLIIDPEVKE